MSRTLYEHERHPLDIIAEEEAKEQDRKQKKLETKLQNSIDWQLSRPLEELSIGVLQAEIMLHLGREYLYATNKVRREKQWPASFQECVTFLKEHGLKQ